MLIVHHLGVSQSERVVWLCEELDIPYKLVKHTRAPALSPESLKSIPGNETGKAPFIEDTDANITLSESGAICEYIIARYGNGKLALPPSHEDFPVYLHWMHFANGTLQSNMVCSMFLELASVAKEHMIQQFASQRLHTGFRVMDDRLKRTKWLTGEDFTAADIMNVYPVTTQRYFGPLVSLGEYPNLLRWLKDCAERPAYQRAMEKGDPEMKLLLDAEPPKVDMNSVGGVESNHWKK